MLYTIQKKAKRIADLIVLYIKGEITSNKKEELFYWRNTSLSNRKVFDECTSSSFFEKALLEVETEPECRNLIWKKIRQKTVIRKKKRKLRVALGAAASIILMVGVSAIFLLTEQNQVMEIQPGKSFAILELADGKQISLETNSSFTHISNIGTEITQNNNTLNYQAAETRQVAYNTLKTPRGAEYKLILSDGTKVFLNAASELYYPELFTENHRKVKLKGEAVFEVSHNPDMPFIVEINGKQIEVLGTTFNIRYYPEDNGITTTLVEGKVKVKSKNKSAILNPGQQAVIDVSFGNIETREVDTKYYTAWHEGRLIYDNEPLDKILMDLSRWYDFDISYMDSQAKKIRFSCNLERYDKLNTFLTILKKTNKVKINLNKNSITVQTQK